MEFDDARLSRIDTLWSVVRQAHTSDAHEAASAQQMLLQRYSGAIRRYLLGALRDADLADELFQEFAYKFIKGDFRSVDPDRGKFRSFVKTVLFRMVALHFRKKSKSKLKNVENLPEPAAAEEESSKEKEERFLLNWRDDILARTWEKLAAVESNGGPKYNTVLRTRVANPSANSNELAELVSTAVGKEVTSGNVRVQVHRAREKFASLLIENIADSLESATREAVESELIDLRLIDYCRDSLDSYKRFAE